MKQKWTVTTALLMLGAAIAPMTGCSDDPDTQRNMEDAGSHLEEAGDHIGEAAKDLGEEAGKALEKAAHETGKAMQEAGREIEENTRENRIEEDIEDRTGQEVDVDVDTGADAVE